MPYDWNDPTEGNKLPEGKHTVTITRVLRTKKQDGHDIALTDKEGNPQVGIAMQDQEGREAMMFFSLAGSYVWRLKKLLQAILSPQELAYLTNQGFTPMDFTVAEKSDPLVVTKWLVITGAKGKNDFLNWTPSALPTSTPAPVAAPAAADEVPF